MVLGKLPVPRRPTHLDHGRARAYCACSRCGWVLFGHFSLVHHFSLLSPSLWETVRYRLKYCCKGQLSLKQPTICHEQFWWEVKLRFHEKVSLSQKLVHRALAKHFASPVANYMWQKNLWHIICSESRNEVNKESSSNNLGIELFAAKWSYEQRFLVRFTWISWFSLLNIFYSNVIDLILCWCS